MDTLVFASTEFNIRGLNLPEFGKVLISTTTLNDALLKEGTYVSEEAIKIDEKIFYFVEPEEINLSDKELKSIISQQILC